MRLHKKRTRVAEARWVALYEVVDKDMCMTKGPCKTKALEDKPLPWLRQACFVDHIEDLGR